MARETGDGLMVDEREILARAVGRIETRLEAMEEQFEAKLDAIEARLAKVDPAVKQVNDLLANAGFLRKSLLWVLGGAGLLGFWQVLDMLDKGIDFLKGLGR